VNFRTKNTTADQKRKKKWVREKTKKWCPIW